MKKDLVSILSSAGTWTDSYSGTDSGSALADNKLRKRHKSPKLAQSRTGIHNEGSNKTCDLISEEFLQEGSVRVSSYKYNKNSYICLSHIFKVFDFCQQFCVFV